MNWLWGIKNKINRSLLLSIACGLVAFLISAIYFQYKDNVTYGSASQIRVLVATRDIKPHTLLNSGMFELRTVPDKFVQPGVIKNIDKIRGKVSIAPIMEGEQLLVTKIVIGGQKTSLSAKIFRNKRAVSLLVKDEDISTGLIQPDDFVDLIVIYDYGDREVSDMVSFTLFQRKKILAVGRKMHSIRNPMGVAIIKEKEKGLFSSKSSSTHMKMGGTVYTLELTPDEVQELVLAKKSGEVTLALRGNEDKDLFRELKKTEIKDITGRVGLIRRRYREYRGR